MKSAELTHVQEELAKIQSIQTDLNYSIDAINRAGIAFAGAKIDLQETTTKLTGKLKDHAKAHPLSSDCKPDDFRIGVLRDANKNTSEKFRSSTGQ